MAPRSVAAIGGTDVHEAEIAAPDGTVARVLGYGAILRDLIVPLPDGTTRRVVLGFGRAEDYADNPDYLGVTAGRHANRIRDGRFTLDGTTHRLTLNERGRTHLHGGTGGFSRRHWRLVEVAPDAVTLALTSPDGEDGYPGTVEARCTYRLSPATLRVEMTATTDAPTVVGLAHHSYFTLVPGRPVTELMLTVAGAHYTPVGDDLLPTGEIAPVAGTPLDFRTPRPVGTAGGLDHNFVLDARPPGFAFAARVAGPDLALEVWTDQPGLQVYDGAYLKDAPGVGLDGARHFPNAGLCLEPQTFPDGPNQPAFPSPVLRPGETYRQITEYRFTAP